MLRRYIEHREKALYGRDTNRRPLPFEWGAEHAGIAANGNPHAALRDLAWRAVRDSEAFYACTPGTEYTFDGEVLRFPSAVKTSYPENNTVWGRFFDGGKDLAVLVLPQWNCNWDGQVGLCKALQLFGISSLRLSMPYHHHRKPPHLERAEYLVSPNIGRTIAASRQAVLDARRAAGWLLDRGHRRLAIIGTSVGSCIAFLTFAHDPRFAAGVFIHVSGFYADVVWTGLSTRHVRYSLESALDLESLRELWAPISPYPFIRRLHGANRPIQTISGRYDLTFLPELSRQTYTELDRRHIPHERIWLPCGHYTMGKMPFSVLACYRIVRFLKRVPA